MLRTEIASVAGNLLIRHRMHSFADSQTSRRFQNESGAVADRGETRTLSAGKDSVWLILSAEWTLPPVATGDQIRIAHQATGRGWADVRADGSPCW